MKILLQFSFVIITMLFLTGCFEIVEKMHLNADGSGTYDITFNASQSKERLKRVMAQDSIGQVKVPSLARINEKLTQAKNQLLNQPGIEKASYSIDQQNYIVEFNVTFKELTALNKAYDSFFKGDNKIYFSKSNESISRNISEKVIQELNKKLLQYPVFKIGSGHLTSIYSFEQPIESSSCPVTKLSKTGKSCLTRVSLGDLLADADECQRHIYIYQK